MISQLIDDSEVGRIIAIDRLAMPRNDLPYRHEKVEVNRLDLLRGDVASAIAGCDSIVHLAEERGRPDDSVLTLALLNAVLVAADQADVHHLVVLSSAMAYGAHVDNPVPLTEIRALRPVPELAYAVAKKEMEDAARAWGRATRSRQVAILRPTTTLSQFHAAWAAKAMRSATVVRPDQVDPPVQFLHYDDLASALVAVTRQGLDGPFNVAPDGWIGPDVFRDLVGGVQLRAPDRVGRTLRGAGRRMGMDTAPEGIDAYVRYPWVVSNDRLRQTGWSPVFSNSEAFVLGTPPPRWSVTAKERQELALTVAGLGVAGAAAVVAAVARRALK